MDALASSHPISVDVENPADIATIFDGITYQKVSWHEILTSNTRKGLPLLKCITKFYIDFHYRALPSSECCLISWGSQYLREA